MAQIDIEEVVRRNWQTIKNVVPEHITPERLARIAVTAIRITPALKSCSTSSLMDSIVQAAVLGIEPNDGTGRGWIIPYKGTAQFQLGYKGVIDLAYRSGQIDLIDCQVIREGDDFDLQLGTSPRINHVPSLKQSGPMIGVYAVVRVKGVTWPIIEVMGLAEIEKIRRASKTSSKGPWVEWPEEMARKAVVKRGLKRCPTSTELRVALAIEDARDLDVEAVLGKDRASELMGQIAAGNESSEPQQEAEEVEVEQETIEPSFELGPEE